MKMVSKSYKRNTRLYLLGALVAIELLMSFSFLGYLHVEPISITFAYVPVLLAGALVGLPEAVVLGTIFGLASMWKASASYVMPLDQLFSPVMSGHPLESILLSVGTRMLFGLLTGLLYLVARRLRYTGLWVCLVSFFGRFLHTFLVYGAMGLFFPEAGYGVWDAFASFGSLNSMVANLVTTGIVFLVWRMEKSRFWQEYRARVERARSLQVEERYHWLSLWVMLLLTICLAVAVAVYFVYRMDYVLEQSGIVLSDTNHSNLVHLQVQFVIGILSMMALVIVFLVFNRRYATYLNYEAKMDSLTGLMTRRAFFAGCARSLQAGGTGESQGGYFIMVDVDHFKGVNDRYGHPEGDRLLREIARKLQIVFDGEALIGRVGGDEFAVLLPAPVLQERLEADLRLFQEQVRTIRAGEDTISCSAGVVAVRGDKTVEALYQEADRMLYRAKQQGRDCYVLDMTSDSAASKERSA